MTNLPLDEKGRYTISTVIDGKTFQAKYYQCADVSCMEKGANIDTQDAGTVAYQNAMFKKGMSYIGKGAAVVTLVNPLGAAGAVASTVGLGTSVVSGSADNDYATPLLANSTQAAGEGYLRYVWKLPETAAKRVAAFIELLGGWDAYAQLLNPSNNPNKKNGSK